MRHLHLRWRLSPDALTWTAFVVSVAAAVALALGPLAVGLALVFAGQLIDGLDGRMAREFGLASERGRRLDDRLDRASEGLIFGGIAFAGLVSWRAAALAFLAVLLVTSIAHRSRLDPAVKRFALYFGPWLGFPVIFAVIFWVHLAAYVAGLLVLDARFQRRMDALGGDLDTVASRAAALDRGTRASMPGESAGHPPTDAPSGGSSTSR